MPPRVVLRSIVHGGSTWAQKEVGRGGKWCFLPGRFLAIGATSTGLISLAQSMMNPSPRLFPRLLSNLGGARCSLPSPTQTPRCDFPSSLPSRPDRPSSRTHAVATHSLTSTYLFPPTPGCEQGGFLCWQGPSTGPIGWKAARSDEESEAA